MTRTPPHPHTTHASLMYTNLPSRYNLAPPPRPPPAWSPPSSSPPTATHPTSPPPPPSPPHLDHRCRSRLFCPIWRVKPLWQRESHSTLQKKHIHCRVAPLIPPPPPSIPPLIPNPSPSFFLSHPPTPPPHPPHTQHPHSTNASPLPFPSPSRCTCERNSLCSPARSRQ